MWWSVRITLVEGTCGESRTATEEQERLQLTLEIREVEDRRGIDEWTRVTRVRRYRGISVGERHTDTGGGSGW